MDPASIIGVASGAITFVEFGYKFLFTLYTVYQDGEAIAGHQELMAVNEEMQRLSLSVLKTSSPADSSGSPSAEMAGLARLCYTLSLNLSKELAKSKPQGRGAMQMVKATIRAISSRDEIDRLQKALDNCRAQLHLHHAISHSVEMKQSLERVELASTFFINSVDKSRENANRVNILSSLAFDAMNERYNSISEAAPSTYEWIFCDRHTATASSSLGAAQLFKKWLVSGNGIFHLSGKLGAGKSTLMKFLCHSSKTTSELRSWAGQDTLVLGKFFFWNPGTALQNSLLGMARSILHQTLCKCPDLVPVVFSQFWNPTQYDFLGSPLPLQMDHKAIFGAFDALFRDSALYRTHKACFFIDGLDELVEEQRSYSDLVDWLQGWVDRSGGSLKLCVSSRELPVFLDYLDAKQRIRLQDLSGNDITAVIRQTLGRNRRFVLLQQQNQEQCSEFMSEIAHKSDGVFLWVTLTLKMIIDSLDGIEPLDAIIAQVDSLPQELETLFSLVLKSIPKAQRTSAYFYLAYALGLATIQADTRVSLWLFLDDYIKSRNFAKELPFGFSSQEEIITRLGITADRIQGRTRGLLEVSKSDRDGDFGGWVAFSHRSIPEYLQSALETEEIRRHIQDFDFIDAHINVLLASAKSTQRTYHAGEGFIQRELNISPLIEFISGMKETTASKYFYELNLLDEALNWQYSPPRQPPVPLRVLRLALRVSAPVAVACQTGFYDYVFWKAATYPEALRNLFDVIMETMYLIPVNPLIRIEGESTCSSEHWLRKIMKHGMVDPNQWVDYLGGVRVSLWASFLQVMCFFGASPRHWVPLEIMLEYGAFHPSWKRSGEIVNFHLGDEVYPYDWDAMKRDWDERLLPAWKVERGDTITLKDWVDEYKPENRDKILMLLGDTTIDDETTNVKAVHGEIGHLEGRSLVAAAWNRLSQLLGKRALPWILVGVLSGLLLRETADKWSGLIHRRQLTSDAAAQW
ncbi:hypothetical protein B0I37DRAFT_200687 [Chaetomium sp. MPI-CAGE-AT-0009]|nr:hypothetical protein B0I37DRAFT_200687 [Chaetomium sp. MPI-CAGE-AT-0009]